MVNGIKPQSVCYRLDDIIKQSSIVFKGTLFEPKLRFRFVNNFCINYFFLNFANAPRIKMQRCKCTKTIFT